MSQRIQFDVFEPESIRHSADDRGLSRTGTSDNSDTRRHESTVALDAHAGLKGFGRRDGNRFCLMWYTPRRVPLRRGLNGLTCNSGGARISVFRRTVEHRVSFLLYAPRGKSQWLHSTPVS